MERGGAMMDAMLIESASVIDNCRHLPSYYIDKGGELVDLRVWFKPKKKSTRM